MPRRGNSSDEVEFGVMFPLREAAVDGGWDIGGGDTNRSDPERGFPRRGNAGNSGWDAGKGIIACPGPDSWFLPREDGG